MIDFKAYCEQHPLAASAPREAFWRRSSEYTRLVSQERIARLTAERDLAMTRVADVPGIDLLLTLVCFVDSEHDFDGSGCHPTAPGDCSPHCRACQTLRVVRDDVLLAARAQAALAVAVS